MGFVVTFFETLGGTLLDVMPIVAIMGFFQFAILRRPIRNPGQVAMGFALVLLGLAFFLQGLEQALFPLGKLMAAQLTAPEFLGIADSGQAADHGHYFWLYCFAFAIGFATTIAEPSLIAVAIKAHQVSGGTVGIWGLRIAVALGVAIGIALGSYRIVSGTPLHYYIVTGYILVIVQTAYCPRSIIALAYDSGGVTTSTVTVPLVAALGLGLAGTVPGRSPLLDGFGLIAFVCMFPIISVMGYAQFADWRARRSASRPDRNGG